LHNVPENDYHNHFLTGNKDGLLTYRLLHHAFLFRFEITHYTAYLLSLYLGPVSAYEK